MKTAKVYHNGRLAGTLIRHSKNDYEFQYEPEWYVNDSLPAISLTLPKKQKVCKKDHLFPFFYNMLSEGVNKKLQCRQQKIDENDHFGLLLATAACDTTGAVTIMPEKTET